MAKGSKLPAFLKSPWAIAAGAAIVLLGFGLFSFLGHSQSVLQSSAGAPISVYIQNPQPGSKFEQGTLVAINAKASGPGPVVSMELWVDGELAQLLSSPGPEGLLGFQADYYLADLPVGVHSVLVRAIGTNFATKASAPLALEIVEPVGVAAGEAEAAYNDPGVSVPAAISSQGGGGAPYFGSPSDDAGSPPNFPESNDPPPLPDLPELETELTPAGPWSLSLGNWFNQLFAPLETLPAAPAIPASAVEVCTPRIWISDNSENEDGFYVYRLDPGLANFLKVATLEAHVGSIFTFEDEEVYGPYQYYVTAFNSAGESAASNIEIVQVDSSNCKPELSGVVFNLGSLFGDKASNRSYCYYTLDGLNWLRHPAGQQTFFNSFDGGTGFVQPPLPEPDSDATPTPLTLNLQVPTPEVLQLVDPAAETLQLADPNETLQLEDPNAFDPGLPPAGANNLLISKSGLPTPLGLDCWSWLGGNLTQVGTWQFENVFADNFAGIEFMPLDNNDDPFFSTAIFNAQLYDILPYDMRVPIPSLALGAGNQVCADHVGGNFILVLVCADIADDLDYGYWDLGECYADLCFNESDVIGYNVYDTLHNNGFTPADTIDDPIMLYFMINGQSCDPRHIRVSALVEYEGELLESFPSNQVFYNGNPNCSFLFGLEPRTYRITLDTIDFSQGNIDDGADSEDDFELYGHVVLRTENYSGHSWNMPVLPCSACEPDIEIHEVDDDAEDNPYSWADFFYLYSCNHDSPLCYEDVLNLDPKIGYNSNTGAFELYLGETAWIDILLSDEDDDTDDAACYAIHAFTFDTYAVDSAPNQTLFFEFSQFDGDEDCVVRGHVELVQ